MTILERLLNHDTWTTRLLLTRCGALTDDQLDQEFDIGHRTIRATFDHLIRNMEVWTSMMAGEEIGIETDLSISGMTTRLEIASARLRDIARKVSTSKACNHLWLDYLEKPPAKKSFGTAIAHLITHSMHHRAHLFYMMRLLGLEDIPEGDVFSWENVPPADDSAQ